MFPFICTTLRGRPFNHEKHGEVVSDSFHNLRCTHASQVFQIKLLCSTKILGKISVRESTHHQQNKDCAFQKCFHVRLYQWNWTKRVFKAVPMLPPPPQQQQQQQQQQQPPQLVVYVVYWNIFVKKFKTQTYLSVLDTLIHIPGFSHDGILRVLCAIQLWYCRLH